MVLRLARTRASELERRLPVSGRRRRAQLRRQRADAARGNFSRHLDPAGGGRRRRRARRGACRMASLRRARRARPTATIGCAARFWARASTTTEIDDALDRAGAHYQRLDDGRVARIASPRRWPRARSSDGSRAAWSSGRARSAPLDHRRRAQSANAVGDEPQDQVSRVVPAVRAVGAASSASPTISSSIARALTW